MHITRPTVVIACIQDLRIDSLTLSLTGLRYHHTDGITVAYCYHIIITIIIVIYMMMMIINY